MKKGLIKKSQSLEILAPSLYIDKNDIYVDKIIEAVNNESVKNLALMGGYGTGKSSVILQFLKSVGRKTKVISFLTFKWQEENNDNSDYDNDSKKHRYNDKISRDMQTEIFKQLYFGLDPKYIPKTKYSRIDKAYPIRKCVGFVLSILGLIASIFLLSNLVMYPDPKNSFCVIALLLLLAIIDIVFFAISLMSYSIEVLSFMPLKKISFYNLSVDLSDDEPDFEQMLDEIIYVFKQAKYEVVVFEDLDRFDNVAIIEELRQLNLILNEALDKKITFIYTINDCLIKETLHRVKMFDAIVPVVPFISEGNAYDYIIDVFSAHNLDLSHSPKVLAVISKYVDDMRELRYLAEIYEEYSLMVKNNFNEPLSDSKLLGLALLRCYYPTALSPSNQKTELDILFEESLKKWNSHFNKLNNDLLTSRDIEDGKYTFLDAIEKEFLSLDGISPEDKFVLIWGGKSSTYPYEELKKVNLVDEIVNNGETLRVNKSGYYGGNLFDINKSYLENHSGPIADYYEHLKKGSEFYRKEICEFEKNVDRFSYLSETDVGNTALRTLIMDLIDAGMIDENYQIFLSKSLHLSSSIELLTFKRYFLRFRKTSYNQKLNKDDIKELLPTLTATDYANPALYNIQFIDYIAIDHEKELDMIINQIKDGDGKDFIFKFLDIYCDHEIDNMLKSVNPDEINSDTFEVVPVLHFIQKLAAKYPIKTISHILYNEITEHNKAQEYYFLAAISDINLSIPIIFRRDYSEKFSKYFDSAVKCGFATQISYIMSQNNYPIPNVRLISDNTDALQYAINAKNFTLNKENVGIFSGEQLLTMIKNEKLAIDEFLIIVKKITKQSVQLLVDIFENFEKIPNEKSIYEALSEKVYLLDQEQQSGVLLKLASNLSEASLINTLVEMPFLSDEEFYQILDESSSDLSMIHAMPRKIMRFPNTPIYRRFCNILLDKKIATSVKDEKSELVIRISKDVASIMNKGS